MDALFQTVREVTLLEDFAFYLLDGVLFAYACEHFYKWLYWKTKKDFFKKINWLSSPLEIDAYCTYQDQLKEKRRNKRGRD